MDLKNEKSLNTDNLSETKLAEIYGDVLPSKMIFRFFLRKMYKNVEISNEECDLFRIEFTKYLFDLNLTEKQKDTILPKSEFDIIRNLNHPLKTNGFHSAYIIHFTEFLDKMRSEAIEIGVLKEDGTTL